MKNLLKYPCLVIISLSVFVANAKDPLIEAITISESGARMQAARMKVISENIANAASVSINKKRPYCRRILLVKSKGVFLYDKNLKLICETYQLFTKNGFTNAYNIDGWRLTLVRMYYLFNQKLFM